VIFHDLSVTRSELAEAALACTPLARARLLAEWIGAGREVTTSGVLRPAVAMQACEALGIDLPPGKLRSAKDVPELMQDWDVASVAAFIERRGHRVRAADDLAELGSADPERVLRSWLWIASAALGVPYGACPECLTVLHELSLASAVSVADLAQAVHATTARPDLDAMHAMHVLPDLPDLPALPGVPALPSAVPPKPEPGSAPELLLAGPALPGSARPWSACEYCGEVHDDHPPQEAAEHVASSVDWLTEFGAASTGPGVTPGGTVRLTPLGRMFADSVLAGHTPEPDAGADTLIDFIISLPPKIAQAVSVGWLTARAPAEAVSELLDYAESADPDQRIMALGIARELGPGAAQAWRAWAKRPGFGAYARAWLAEQGEPVTAQPTDEGWLTAEAMLFAGAMMPQGLESLALFMAVQQATSDEVAQTLAKIAESGHQDAERLIDIISSYRPGPGGFTRQYDYTGPEDEDREYDEYEEDGPALDNDTYQLKITLRGVSKPPVWRRVLVPAGLSLDSLHEVIQRAMGWEGGHMHVFSDGWQHYGVENAELDHADETEFAVAEMVEELGDKFSYIYDFGDDWEHEIRFEKVLPPDALAGVPVCLAGKGACPPEDCGGAWGYTDLKATLADPADDEHEERLQWLGLDTASDFNPAAFSLDEVNARLARLRLSADSPN
jgi:Plasmid pRiA4b ORF-3-like protein